MNKTTKIILKAIIILAVILAFLWASNEDFKETVIYNMNDCIYVTIQNKLGNDITRSQIVKEYLSNQQYYDSLTCE